jgi:hypothetical protein
LPASFRRSRWVDRTIVVSAVVLIATKFGVAQFHPDSDARRLAEELQQRLDVTSVDEVVFVDTKVRYGLKHYLDLELEQAESHTNTLWTDGYMPAEALCHELDEPDGQLIVTPRTRGDAVESRILECGLQVERLGTMRKWALLRIPRDNV